MEAFFIDKLNVSQTFPVNDLRLVGKQGAYYFDLQTGESQINPHVSKLKYEGSYSSSLMIRCDGTTIEVNGNPSRFSRLDNLFGFKTLDECFALYNAVLAHFELPLFTKCTKYVYFQGKEGSALVKNGDGANISHIDWTRNLSVGVDNQRTFIKALATQSIGRAVKPYLYADENTVEWFGANVQRNGSTFRYIKVYNKYFDLLRHQKKTLKDASLQSAEYFQKLLDFCLELGVVREEHSFKRPLLKKMNCFAWGLFSESQFESELTHIDDVRKRLEVTKMNYTNISQQLIDEGVCKSRHAANTTQSYYMMWLHGMDMDKQKRQYFDHKSRLLQIGIDISVKLDISRSPVRLKSTEVLEVKILSEPEWYQKPTSHLKLVA